MSGGGGVPTARSDACEAFDDFIRRWVSPAMQAHLLDCDDNDGERVRRAIRGVVR